MRHIGAAAADPPTPASPGAAPVAFVGVAEFHDGDAAVGAFPGRVGVADFHDGDASVGGFSGRGGFGGGSGRDGSARVGSGRVGSGRDGSGRGGSDRGRSGFGSGDDVGLLIFGLQLPRNSPISATSAQPASGDGRLTAAA